MAEDEIDLQPRIRNPNIYTSIHNQPDEGWGELEGKFMDFDELPQRYGEYGYDMNVESETYGKTIRYLYLYNYRLQLEIMFDGEEQRMRSRFRRQTTLMRRR